MAWANEVLKQSLEEETDFHNKAVARLNAELEQLKRRMNQACLDKLDGKIDEEFWAECSGPWQAEKARITERIARHGQAESTYLEEGARLLDVAGRAVQLYREHGQAERRGFLASILENVPGQGRPGDREGHHGDFFMRLKPDRFFVRGLLPVRLTDGHEFHFGVWIEVSAQTCADLMNIWNEPGYAAAVFEA